MREVTWMSPITAISSIFTGASSTTTHLNYSSHLAVTRLYRVSNVWWRKILTLKHTRHRPNAGLMPDSWSVIESALGWRLVLKVGSRLSCLVAWGRHIKVTVVSTWDKLKHRITQIYNVFANCMFNFALLHKFYNVFVHYILNIDLLHIFYNVFVHYIY